MTEHKIYKLLKVSFAAIFLSFACSITARIFGMPRVIAVIANYTYLVSYIIYLFFLGKLLLYKNLDMGRWIILTIMTQLIGVAVSYYRMKNIAVEEGWDSQVRVKSETKVSTKSLGSTR